MARDLVQPDPGEADGTGSLHPLHASHERTYQENRFVYPVLSRRSEGLSLGVNLNPDKICNFDCIYCQVDRTVQAETTFVEMDRLIAELDPMLAQALSGEIFRTAKFRDTPERFRRLNDIAFSGDGEPTTYRNFPDIVEACADVKRRHGADEVKLLLISNASMFHRPHVQRGLEILAENQGEIWAKLETGTQEYYQQVERTPVPFQQVLDNITAAAKRWPLVIQSMFMRIDNDPPSKDELLAYCGRLNDIMQAGGQIKLVQIYTVARPPAESNVTPLSDLEVDAIFQMVHEHCGIEALPFYGMPD